MSIIILPSKNIYNINHNKVPQNNIGSIEKYYNKVEEKKGNILDKKYRFRYLYSSNDFDFITGNQAFKNPENTEGFQFDIIDSQLKATLVLPLAKLSNIQLFDSAGHGIFINSHQFKQEKTFTSQDGTISTKDEFIQSIPLKNADSRGMYFDYSVNPVVNNKALVEETLSLNGVYYEFTETLNKMGDGEGSINLASNEFVQEGAQNLNRYADDILSQYANGKETATIRCDISEYYDEYGDLVISTKTSDKILFEHYDKVIPMVRNAVGKDEPLSLLPNGFAKVFEVIGTRVYYDGAVWQELTLRETGESAALYNPYLTFSSDTDFTLKTFNSTKNWDGTLEYSTNARDWNVWHGTTTLNSRNGKLYLRGIENKVISGIYNADVRWVLEGTNIECRGNIENLLDYRDCKQGKHPTISARCFSYLFYDNKNLIIPPSLLFIEAPDYCCGYMFYGCTNLIALPRLYATYIGRYGYGFMFSNCSKIKVNSIPEPQDIEYRIPFKGDATTDSSYPADRMFVNTSSTVPNNVELNKTYYTSNQLV